MSDTSDRSTQVTAATARTGQVVQVFANNWKLFGFLVSWDRREIVVRSGRKLITKPACEVNVVHSL
jgi:hypothetical protein